MPERLEKLRETLAELEDELQGMESLDDETRSLLEEVSAEIQTALHQRDPDALEPDSLAERLTASVQDFESSHPTLAGVVTRMIHALGQMGI